MQGDLSRVTFDRRKHYSGVVAQQGRVQLDADLNEGVSIRRHREVTSLEDVVGGCGAPKYDAGFAIAPAPGAGASDLVIAPGRYYVHGEMCELEGTPVAATPASATDVTVADWRPDDLAFAAGQFVELSADGIAAAAFRVTVADAATLTLTLDPALGAFAFAAEISVRRLASYLTQPDLPDAPPLAGLPDGSYVVYLDVWQRHVNAIVDGAIRESALGGPDTSTRSKTVWQVRLFPPPDGGAASLPDDVTCSTPVPGWDEATGDPTGRLSARTQPGEEPGPCTVPPGAGYLGLENQLYRIEVHQGGTLGVDAVSFKWSRDDASVAKAIEPISGTTDHTVADADPDDVLGLANGQWVEQVDDAVDLVPIARDLFQFAKDPVSGAVTLLHPVDEDRHPFLRRWDGDGETVVPSPPVGDGWLDIENGIQVRFGDGTYRTGDHWLVPARTALGDIEWPLDENGDPLPQARRGIGHVVCRIAVLHAAGGVLTVDDCRPIVPPLNELKSCPTCCTLTVSNRADQPGDFTTIQDAVDHLPAEGGEICVLAGTYTENVIVSGKHDVRISGCCDRSRVVSAAPVADAAAAPVFRIVDSTSIVLEHLVIEADETGIGVLVEREETDCTDITLQDLDVTAALQSAIEVLDASDVTIERCEIDMTDANGGWPGIFLKATDSAIRECRVTGPLRAMSLTQALTLKGSLAVSAVQLAGGCERVTVEDNVLDGCSGQGVTLGSVEQVDANGDPTGDPIGWVSGGDDPCVDCGDPSSGDDPGGTDGGGPTLRSSGDLYDISILENRIVGMGLDGIGVVHFFDITQESRRAGVVRIERLEIAGNRIERCVRRAFGPIAEGMIDLMAYGGISLSFVEGLVVRDNDIEDIGLGGFLPVCGIFVLYGEGIEIDRNRVLNGGLAASQFADDALRGRRGGIHILFATVLLAAAKDEAAPAPPVDVLVNVAVSSGNSLAARVRRADIAVVVEENTVDVNRGQALVIGAVGPVGVVSNRLISRGLVRFDLLGAIRGSGALTAINLLTYLSSLVAIVDLGSSGLPGLAPNAAVGAQAKPTAEVSSLQRTSRGPSGNILYADNQSHLDLGGSRFTRGPALAGGMLLPAILVLGMDDVGFHDNQCDADVDDGVFPAANVIFGLVSVRATSNRWKETLGRALYSAITAGLMDLTVDNQANHCIGAVGILKLTHQPNHELISVFAGTFCANAERKLAAAFHSA